MIEMLLGALLAALSAVIVVLLRTHSTLRAMLDVVTSVRKELVYRRVEETLGTGGRS